MNATPEPPLTRRERLRRVAIVCIAMVRNLAYYRAGRDGTGVRYDRTSRLHGAINTNFIDMAVLEWCKLFVAREEHSWQNVVTDKAGFEAALLADAGISKADFEAYILVMRTYRDKFLAHLDSRREMNVPDMEIAKKTAAFYHRYLLANENDNATYAPDLDFDIEKFFTDCAAEAEAFYQREFPR